MVLDNIKQKSQTVFLQKKKNHTVISGNVTQRNYCIISK